MCECIVVMKGVREVSWKTAKGMMSEANFLRTLKEMDVDNISQRQIVTVKGRSHYFQSNIQIFTISNSLNILGTCSNLGYSELVIKAETLNPCVLTRY